MNQIITVGHASAQIICDSLCKGSRLTSVEATFPRPYLAENNTHGLLSKNSASSRAIPTWKVMKAALDRPYVPAEFGLNKPGMQGGEPLSDTDQASARFNWLQGRDFAVIQAYYMTGGESEILKLAKESPDAIELVRRVKRLAEKYDFAGRFALSRGAHKQHPNRVLEPYSYHTAVLTATHWRNYFGLRANGDAQPEMDELAVAIATAMMRSQPRELNPGEWHLPYVSGEETVAITEEEKLPRVSAFRVARVSYLTQNVKRSIDEEVGRANALIAAGHMSPFQHVARPREKGDPKRGSGNFKGVWTQYRKLLPHEGDFTRRVPRETLIAGCFGDEALADFILSLPD